MPLDLRILSFFFYLTIPIGEKEGWRKCLDINLMGVLNGIDVMSRKSLEQYLVTMVNVAYILGLFNVQQSRSRVIRVMDFSVRLSDFFTSRKPGIVKLRIKSVLFLQKVFKRSSLIVVSNGTDSHITGFWNV